MSKTKKKKAIFIILAILIFLAISVWYLSRQNIAVLNPKGPIALQERNLMYTALALALLVVIPVFTITGIFAWRYREGNTKAKYSPDLAGNRIVETIWWLIPSCIILVLATIAWNSSHTLDPYKTISSTNKPITIQVIALDWKWLFIYPQQKVASVNFFQFPVNTPLDFEITSDAPMNSFWIPQLGGQIYAMPGMSTQLHLLASSAGSYNGSSANISGQGFAGMTFVAKATSESSYNQWIESLNHSTDHLTMDQYNKLSQPSENNPPAYYGSVVNNLFDSVIYKYMPQGYQMTGMGI